MMTADQYLGPVVVYQRDTTNKTRSDGQQAVLSDICISPQLLTMWTRSILFKARKDKSSLPVMVVAWQPTYQSTQR